MRQWSITSARAGFSNLVRLARRAPQVIEHRGYPVAVVISAAAYERITTQPTSQRWIGVMLAKAPEVTERPQTNEPRRVSEIEFRRAPDEIVREAVACGSVVITDERGQTVAVISVPSDEREVPAD
jgi:prevent-host-death family protein